jgi:hypothetical protein
MIGGRVVLITDVSEASGVGSAKGLETTKLLGTESPALLRPFRNDSDSRQYTL